MTKENTIDLINKKRCDQLKLTYNEAKFLQYYTDMVSKNYGLKELKETNIDGYNAIKKLDKLVKLMERKNDLLHQAIKQGLVGVN
tara:strand:+ start:280 stop:534 length:255 start_codon:yes stop_codon:yes gene_type:complete